MKRKWTNKIYSQQQYKNVPTKNKHNYVTFLGVTIIGGLGEGGGTGTGCGIGLGGNGGGGPGFALFCPALKGGGAGRGLGVGMGRGFFTGGAGLGGILADEGNCVDDFSGERALGDGCTGCITMGLRLRIDMLCYFLNVYHI